MQPIDRVTERETAPGSTPEAEPNTPKAAGRAAPVPKGPVPKKRGAEAVGGTDNAPDDAAADRLWNADSRDLRAQAARADAAERRRIGFKLRQALNHDEFVLLFQPRIHLASGLVRGAEALIRLPHRRRGLIKPAHFVPIAERSELINDIGAWVLIRACQEAADWPSRYTVSVNISARQLADGKLIKQVIEALAVTDLPPSRLELELTESTLIERTEDTAFSLNAVRAMGVGLSLDDFGTGYASLSLIKRLPLTAIKLDRTLVRDLPGDREDLIIARAAIEAGHALKLAIVAEGVETEAQRACLTELGCDEAQGHLFGPAMPAARIREWLVP